MLSSLRKSFKNVRNTKKRCLKIIQVKQENMNVNQTQKYEIISK
jgi:uncharacterized protein YlaN (UPF0358 family)